MKLRRWLVDAIPPLLLLVVVLIVWSAVVRIWDLKPYLLPGPELVAGSLQKNGLKLLRAMSLTGAAAISGLMLSLIIGTLVAILFSQSGLLRRSGYPYAIFLQTVPIVAIAPLIVQWFGRGFQSLVLTSFIISLFPIIANGTTGLLRIDTDLLDLFRLHNASRSQVLWKLRLPNAVPDLCTGVRTASGLAIVGAIVGEFYAGYGGRAFGLGYLILATADQANMVDLLAAVCACTLLGVTIFGAVSGITTIILRRWYDAPPTQRD